MAGKLPRCSDALRSLLGLGGAAALVLLLFACPSPIDDKLLVIVEDKLAPSINILTPKANGTYKGTLTVTGTVIDSSRGAGDNQGVMKSFAVSVLDASVLNRVVTFTKEGAYTVAPSDPSFTYNKADGNFGLQINTVGLTGIRLVTFVAEDWNGNRAEKTLTIYEDTTGPYLRIDTPAEMSQYRSSVTVTGTVANSLTDVGVSWSQVQKLSWSMPGTSFTDVDIPQAGNWDDGTYTISFSTVGPPIITGNRSLIVTAEDFNGHKTVVGRTLSEYPSGPQLTLSAPADYSNYGLAITITGSVANSAAEPGVVSEVKTGSLTYKLGGDSEVVIPYAADGTFSTTASSTGKQGQLTLKLSVKDLNGHETVVLRTLLDSNSGPYLAFDRPPTPAADSFYKSSFTVQGVVQNSSTDAFLTNVQALSYVYPGITTTSLPVASPFSFSVSTATYSTPFTVRVYATDFSSRTTELNFTLYNDGVGPNIAITSPANFSYYGSSVTVSGTILDESSATGEIDTSTLRYSVSPSGASGADLLPYYNTGTGAYSFTFSTTGFTTDQVVSITAKDKNKNATTQTITIKKDSVLPTITTATITAVPGVANDQAVVVFSKNVNQAAAETAANYTFANTATGKIVSLSGATLAYDNVNKRTTITFSAGDQPASDEGTGARFQYGVSYTVAVTTIQDLSGNTINDSKVVAAGGDNSPPAITSVKQMLSVDSTGKTVDVTFNEALDRSDAQTAANYVFSGAGAPTTSTAALQGDNLTVRLTLSAAIKPWVHTLNSPGNVRDLAGNGASGAVPAVTSTDVTAPTLSSVTQMLSADATGMTVDLVFSEKMDEGESEKTANYTFSGAGAPSVSTATYNDATKTVRLVLGAAVKPWVHKLNILVNKLYDPGGNTLAAVVDRAVTSTDVTAPTLSSVTQMLSADAAGMTVDLVFSEKMDEGEAEKAANYTFSGAGAPSVSTATYNDATKTVRLVLGAAVKPWVHKLNIAVDKLYDPGGNTLAAVVDRAVTSTDVTAPTLSSVTQMLSADATGMTVDLVFSEKMDEGEAEKTANYTFSGAGAPSVSTATYNDATKTVRLVLGAAVKPWVHKLNILVNELYDPGGNTLAAVVDRAVTSTDVTAPTLSSVTQMLSADAAGMTVDLVFSEKMDEGEAEKAANYTFSGAGAPSVSTATYNDATKTVRLVLGAAVKPWVHKLNIAVDKLYDPGGNTLAAVVDRAVTSTDVTAPTLSSVTQMLSADAAGMTVDLVFSEKMDEGEAEKAANYTFSGAGAPSVSTATYNDATKTVRLVLGAAVKPWVHKLNIAVDKLYDPGGNTLAAVVDRAVTSTDSTSPALAASKPITASGSVVSVEYDEAVDVASATTKANYTLNGTPNISSAAMKSGSDRIVELTCSAAVSVGADTLTIDPAKIRNLAGLYFGGTTTHAIEAPEPGLKQTKPITVLASTTEINIEFDEDIDSATVTTLSTYTLGGTSPPNVTAAALASAKIIKLTCDAAVTAGTHTLTISSGVIKDLSGLSFSGTSDHAIEAP